MFGGQYYAPLRAIATLQTVCTLYKQFVRFTNSLYALQTVCTLYKQFVPVKALLTNSSYYLRLTNCLFPFL